MASGVDAFLDFGIPSALTRDPRNTVDGSHFTPEANDRVADELRARRGELSLDVKGFADARAYRDEVRRRLREFVAEQGQASLWRE